MKIIGTAEIHRVERVTLIKEKSSFFLVTTLEDIPYYESKKINRKTAIRWASKNLNADELKEVRKNDS